MNKGGTATAYWLLATTLARYTEPDTNIKPFKIRFLVPSAPSMEECQALNSLYKSNGVELICIDPKATERKWAFVLPYLTQGAAVLDWFRNSNKRECDVMHVHEWGGIAAPILQARLLGENVTSKLPSIVATESHGGHMWSALSLSPRRPADLVALEVDFHERMTLEDSDTTLSPSRYMLRYFHERGWKVNVGGWMPNILDFTGLPPASDLGGNATAVYKPPTRVVFFSRLEDRKGLHVFAYAMDYVANKTSAPLTIDFMGKEGLVHRMKALTYLKTHIKRWPKTWTIRIMTELPRAEALEKLTMNKDNTLVILPSLVENMPYVVAECASLQMQTVMFDVGGVREMLVSGTIVRNRDAYDLGTTIWQIVNGEQRAEKPILADAITKSDKTWIEWHRRLWRSGKLPKIQTVDGPGTIPGDVKPTARGEGNAELKMKLGGRFACRLGVDKDCPRVATIDPNVYPDALSLYDKVCRQPDAELANGNQLDELQSLLLNADTLLLSPGRFRVMNGKTIDPMIRTLYSRGDYYGAVAGAVRAGTRDSDAITMPHGPFYYARLTWKRCIVDYPVLVKKDIFCRDFTADSRSFHDYKTWLLMMLLEQGGSEVAILPDPIFEITGEDQNQIYDICNEESDPLLRMAHAGEAVVMDLRSEAAVGRIREIVVSTPQQGQEKIIADSTSDFKSWQGENGWEYLFRGLKPNGQPEKGAPKELVFNPKLGMWQCPPTNANGTSVNDTSAKDLTWFGFPFVKSNGLHPCAANKGEKCCDGKDANSVIMRWTAPRHIEIGAVRVSFQLMGKCGDGLVVTLKAKTGSISSPQAKVLEVINFERDSDGTVTIQNPVEATYELGRLIPGDTVEVEVSPNQSQDCDLLGNSRVQLVEVGLDASQQQQ